MCFYFILSTNSNAAFLLTDYLAHGVCLLTYLVQSDDREVWLVKEVVSFIMKSEGGFLTQTTIIKPKAPPLSN